MLKEKKKSKLTDFYTSQGVAWARNESKNILRTESKESKIEQKKVGHFENFNS